MAHNESSQSSISVRTIRLPRIAIPEEPAITPEELERRRRLYERARALREEIGSIGISTDELIRQVREEVDARCGG